MVITPAGKQHETKTHLIPAAALVILQSLLIFVPMAILGAAINWPESLSLPPAEALPLIAQNLAQVRLGYGIYLGYSVLFAFTGCVVAWLSVRNERAFGPVFMLAVGLACVSALARTIGIIRWLTASTELAAARAVSGADIPAIDVVQLAVNAWGGGIGEALGVAIFASAWLVVVSTLITSNKSLPTWLGLVGYPVAMCTLLPASELFGVEIISISISASALHFWLLAVGVVAIPLVEQGVSLKA